MPQAFLGFAAAVRAETSFPLAAGDTIITGFPGTILTKESLPAGVNPIDKTVIDKSAPSLQIFDLTTLGGAPAGQHVSPPAKLSISAEAIGQVFPLAIDPGKDGAPPNIYAGASSAFGLQIVEGKPGADGVPVRLKAGAPGAKFMDGQFGGLEGASPGAIFKIDGATGEPSLFADTAVGGAANSGPALGGLAFDPASRNLYASDLESGLIHRFAVDDNATNLGQFDHGVTARPTRGLDALPDDGKRAEITSDAFKAGDPATWGFTQEGRRVRAMAVHDGRLYYAVDEGPEIWSVGLNEDGSFADDARSELLVKADSESPIASMAFDASGNMLLCAARRAEEPL